MMDENFDSKLNVYMRSEKAIFEVLMRNKMRQLLFMMIASLLFFTALVMLDIGVFFTLTAYFQTKETAYILAFSNILLCVMCMMLAKRKRHEKEMKALEEIRDYTKAEVVKELQETKNEVLEVSDSVKRVANNISSVTNEVFSLASLVPILKKVLKHK